MRDTILGCTFATISGLFLGLIGVMSRKLKDVSFLTLCIHSGLVMTVITLVTVYADNIFRGSPVQIFSYSFD